MGNDIRMVREIFRVVMWMKVNIKNGEYKFDFGIKYGVKIVVDLGI